MPTINGHKYYIAHPGYGEAKETIKGRYHFIFSDDIRDWMGRSQKDKREKDKERQKRNYKAKSNSQT